MSWRDVFVLSAGFSAGVWATSYFVRVRVRNLKRKKKLVIYYNGEIV